MYVSDIAKTLLKLKRCFHHSLKCDEAFFSSGEKRMPDHRLPIQGRVVRSLIKLIQDPVYTNPVYPVFPSFLSLTKLKVHQT